MPNGLSDISQQAPQLHILITMICAVVGLAVYGILIWSLLKYRKSSGAKAKPFHENTATEILWTIVPILILVAMAIPSIYGIA